MDFLQTQLAMNISISAYAARLIEQYLTLPMLAGLYISPIDYSENKKAQVSKKSLIVQEGRVIINDNIAPEPKVWTISGYIRAEQYEFSSRFAISLKRKKQTLDKSFYSRQAVIFKDAEGFTHEVGIEDLQMPRKAENMNALEITCILTELNTLKTSQSLLETTEQKAQPEEGSKDATASNTGNTKAANKSIAAKLWDKGTDLASNLGF